MNVQGNVATVFATAYGAFISFIMKALAGMPVNTMYNMELVKPRTDVYKLNAIAVRYGRDERF